jgi:hypothetical protein
MSALTISLPRERSPVMPANRCVGCYEGAPDGVWCVSTRQLGTSLVLGLVTPLLWWVPAKARAEFPICAVCRRAARVRYWTGGLATWLAAGTAFGLALWLLPAGWSWRWRRNTAAGIGLLALGPLIVWEVLRPPIVDLTCWKDTVDYEFRDAAFALSFAQANHATDRLQALDRSS